MRPDLLERYAREFEAAGMIVERRQRRRRTVFVISTGDRKDFAQVVWSLMNRDQCYIEEKHDSRGHYVYTTWYPTRYIERLAKEEVRKVWLLVWAVISLIPAIIAFPFGIAARTGSDVGIVAAAAIVLILIGGLTGVARYFKDERGFDTESLLTKLGVGLFVGLVWAASLGLPSITVLVGAVWVFVVSNLVWIGTVGYDRWRFEKCVDRVGGRLSWDEANRTLHSWIGI